MLPTLIVVSVLPVRPLTDSVFFFTEIWPSGKPVPGFCEPLDVQTGERGFEGAVVVVWGFDGAAVVEDPQDPPSWVIACRLLHTVELTAGTWVTTVPTTVVVSPAARTIIPTLSRLPCPRSSLRAIPRPLVKVGVGRC